MAQPELGTKRVCPETGRKFYDLNKDPIVSPFTGKTYPLSFFEAIKPAPSRRVAEKTEDTETDNTEVIETDDETVSLNDLEDDDNSKDDLPDVDGDDDDLEVGDDDDDSTFLEDDEDEDDDMADIIGGGRDDEDDV
ncbi:TIGR02300 family protein [Aureimonas fodinaquatilis]|uniref:TIGR02300 family protein n=1 Tax=Aureimonas fodinaquatilis TaxID=2565783 RepID=A0A5B0DTH0_9HYPH|nr:TIGR02300 family protein [Aureimonas fodinaquatilis]KAA0968459.1 TIGR02300 family protein [Aureimonas fodinaquatilis]